MGKSRALFLDRDGVINVDHGYVCRAEEFEFIDGIFDLCRDAVARDYRIVVVTNQAGIGRGYYTEQDFHALTVWMRERFCAQGVDIADVYFCPFHPEHGIGEFKRESADRKPAPGMILRAAREHALDLAGSVLVGDHDTDLAAGVAAGVGCSVLYSPEGIALPGFPCVRDLREVGPRFLGAVPRDSAN